MVVTTTPIPPNTIIDLIEASSRWWGTEGPVRRSRGPVHDHTRWTRAPFHAAGTRAPGWFRFVEHTGGGDKGIPVIAEVSRANQRLILVVAPATAGNAITTRVAALTSTRLNNILLSNEFCRVAAVVYTVELLMFSARGAMGDVCVSPGIPGACQRA